MISVKPEMLKTERTLSNGIYNSSSGITTRYTFMNASVSLTCEVNGYPQPQVKWYHKGKIVPHHNIVNEANLSTLKVSHA
jgi:hypothetical protein